MSRLVKFNETSPKEVKVGEKSVWICMCGLSKNMPLCDGSHIKTKNEEKGKLYIYDNEKRVEIS